MAVAVVAERQPDVLPAAAGTGLILRLRPAVDLTREQFFQFCQLNPEVRIERLAEGDVDPDRRRVAVYHSDGGVEWHDRPATISGDPVLPGFVLRLTTIWEPPL